MLTGEDRGFNTKKGKSIHMAGKDKHGASLSRKSGRNIRIIVGKMAISFISSFVVGFVIGIIGAAFQIQPYFVGVASGTISGAVVVLIFIDNEKTRKAYL